MKPVVNAYNVGQSPQCAFRSRRASDKSWRVRIGPSGREIHEVLYPSSLCSLDEVPLQLDHSLDDWREKEGRLDVIECRVECRWFPEVTSNHLDVAITHESCSVSIACECSYIDLRS